MSEERDVYADERDLNSYSARTGRGKTSSQDDSGVDTSVESKFPGAQVKYGDDLTTSGSYNRKIPEDEGGDIDSKGRTTRGSQFEGEGGPEDDFAARTRDRGGDNDYDVDQSEDKDNYSSGNRTGTRNLEQGRSAADDNIGGKSQTGGSRFKGEDYYSEDTQDSTAEMGYVPPRSVDDSSQ